MIGIDIEFKNRPNEDGTLSSFTIKDCLVSQTSTPTAAKPEVMVHIPKTSSETVDGAWFDYNDAKIGQGREQTKKYLKEHPDTLAEIDGKVREKVKEAEENS